MNYLSKGVCLAVNRKRTQPLMRQIGIKEMAVGPSTRKRNPRHKVSSCLLRDAVVDRPNQMWYSDFTYIPLRQGFLNVVAVMNWYSRHVIS